MTVSSKGSVELLELFAHFDRDPDDHTIVARMLNLVLHQYPLMARNDQLYQRYQKTLKLLWQKANLLDTHSKTLQKIVGMDENSDTTLYPLLENVMLVDVKAARYIDIVSTLILPRHLNCFGLLGNYAVSKHFSSRKVAVSCFIKASMRDIALFRMSLDTILQKLSELTVKREYCLEALLGLARSNCPLFVTSITDFLNQLEDETIFISVTYLIKIIAYDRNWTSKCLYCLNLSLQGGNNLARKNAIKALAFLCKDGRETNNVKIKTTLYFQEDMSRSGIEELVLKELAIDLEHDSNEVRETAISAFKALKEVGVNKNSIVKCISSCLTSSSGSIRDTAANGISQVISQTDTDCVHILFETMKHSSEQRKSLIGALSRILPQTNILTVSAKTVESATRVEIAFSLQTSPSEFWIEEKEVFLKTLAQVTGIGIERIRLRDVTRVSPTITHDALLAAKDHGYNHSSYNQSYWNSTMPNTRRRRGAAYGGAMTIRVECDILLNKDESCDIIFDSNNLQQKLSEQGYIWLEILRPASVATTDSTAIPQTMMDLLQEEQNHHVIKDALKVMEAMVEQKRRGPELPH
eukprot:768059-Hanusia_phi.AAC.4